MNKKVQRLTLSAMLVSVMMILGYIESQIPIGGIPGIKIGLANSVLLLSLYWLGIPASILLMLAKVFLSGLLFSGLGTSLWFSLAGGVVSLAVMILFIYGIKGVSPIGAGVAGAVMHNVGQVVVAMLLLQIPQLLYYLAILTLVGIGTGIVTGTVAKLLMHHLPLERKKALHLLE